MRQASLHLADEIKRFAKMDDRKNALGNFLLSYCASLWTSTSPQSLKQALRTCLEYSNTGYQRLPESVIDAIVNLVE